MEADNEDTGLHDVDAILDEQEAIQAAIEARRRIIADNRAKVARAEAEAAVTIPHQHAVRKFVDALVEKACVPPADHEPLAEKLFIATSDLSRLFQAFSHESSEELHRELLQIITSAFDLWAAFAPEGRAARAARSSKAQTRRTKIATAVMLYLHKNPGEIATASDARAERLVPRIAELLDAKDKRPSVREIKRILRLVRLGTARPWSS